MGSYGDRIDVLECELYKRQARPNLHDPYSCFEPDYDTKSGLQHTPNPCPADAPRAQTISGERDLSSMFRNLPSQAIVSQVTGSEPVYSFSHE